MTPLPVRLLLLLGPRDSSLAGDLMEEYTGGRSALWLWRQVMAAILVDAASEVRGAPWRAAGSLVVLVLLSRATFALFLLLPHPTAWWIMAGRSPAPFTMMIMSDLLSVITVGAVSGWIGCAIAGRFAIMMLGGLILAFVVPLSVGTIPLVLELPAAALAVLSMYSLLAVAGLGAGSALALWLGRSRSTVELARGWSDATK
jgi:hypothetical protein